MGNRAIALGPIEQHMSCTVVIQRLYESQTHAVAGHSSTNEDSPSCMCFNNCMCIYTHCIIHVVLFMFILAQANTTSLQQLRPLDLFCYYAICAMASKFEIAHSDDAQYNTESLCALGATLPNDAWQPFSKEFPDAKWWKPFSNGGGENAFKEKPELFTSAFNPNGNGTMYAYKYIFSHSINANGQEVKVYKHCGGLHKIFVRRALSLRVFLLTSQVGETTHMIRMFKMYSISTSQPLFEKEFANDGSDITLGQILPVARGRLIANNHVTYQGKVEVIFEGLDITTKLSTVLVKRFGQPNKRQKTSA